MESVRVEIERRAGQVGQVFLHELLIVLSAHPPISVLFIRLCKYFDSTIQWCLRTPIFNCGQFFAGRGGSIIQERNLSRSGFYEVAIHVRRGGYKNPC